MHSTPHVLFRLDGSRDPAEHPPVSDTLASIVRDTCRRNGFAVSDVDLWRDVGWNFFAESEGQRFEIYYAAYGPSRVLLAITPPRPPGWISRILGKRAIPVGSGLRRLCALAHESIRQSSGVTDIHWMFNGPPEDVAQVDEPDRLPWPAV